MQGKNDINQTINDVVNGEVHTIQSVKPECYFRVRGSGSTSQMTNSSLLRRIGREHKGKMLLQKTHPQEVVKDYMVNVGDRSEAPTEGYCRISS